MAICAWSTRTHRATGIPITNEWLPLGFARGYVTAHGPSNATRSLRTRSCCCRNQRIAPGTGAWPTATATAPTCSATTGTGCQPHRTAPAWTGIVPEVASGCGSGCGRNQSGTAENGRLALLLRPRSQPRSPRRPRRASPSTTGIPSTSTMPVKARSATTRWADNSCTTNGVMNAVEIDVGNLAKWLAGTIPGSGTQRGLPRAERIHSVFLGSPGHAAESASTSGQGRPLRAGTRAWRT